MKTFEAILLAIVLCLVAGELDRSTMARRPARPRNTTVVRAAGKDPSAPVFIF
ncbi:hypothetical protein HG264_04180 [Pseudomonas sp. gcc21]|uniref:hypothetical protein n=1 Tax=Pseudomonas sp. gcc21 TaxID=2726989 RepID=UPI0014527A1F|nr:hypothetical protein [Pseudomonas sp. gcc21]QJD58169.1 hypothetical protein HG264_04180 [Pseudomonas sp. gcc21]